MSSWRGRPCVRCGRPQQSKVRDVCGFCHREQMSQKRRDGGQSLAQRPMEEHKWSTLTNSEVIQDLKTFLTRYQDFGDSGPVRIYSREEIAEYQGRMA